MGINGLETYIESNANYLCQLVDLSEIAKGSKEPLILAVDGIGLIYWLFSKQITFKPFLHPLMCEYEKFANKVQLFLDIVHSNNVHLVVFFDGIGEEWKKNTRWSRRIKEVENVNKIRSRLQVSKSMNEFKEKNEQTIPIPLLAKQSLIYILEKNSVEMVQCQQEADHEIAKFAKEPKCYAVLARDTDFLMFDIPRYIPFSKLDICFLESQQSPKHSILQAKIYSSNQLANFLGFSTRVKKNQIFAHLTSPFPKSVYHYSEQWLATILPLNLHLNLSNCILC